MERIYKSPKWDSQWWSPLVYAFVPVGYSTGIFLYCTSDNIFEEKEPYLSGTARIISLITSASCSFFNLSQLC